MNERTTNEEIENYFFELMQKTYRHWELVVKEFNLTVTQAMALRHLEGSQAMRSLAEKLACDASYITALVDGLEKLELVERSPAENDRRIKNLVLTKKGLKIRKQLTERLAENHPVAAGLSAEEKQVIRDVLRTAHDFKH